MAFQTIETENVKAAGGRPYTPAFKCGDWLIISGMVPIDQNLQVVGLGDPERQWRKCLENVQEVVEAAGGTMRDVVMLRVFLTDMRNLNHGEIRKEFWDPPYPAATAIGVTSLAQPDFLVEIEAIGYLGD